jgi:two-component system sensor histidine kinase CiaH
MKKKDIFYYTKRNIIGISIAIVLLCLFIFGGVIKLLYSSILFNDIDNQLIQHKEIILSMPPIVIDRNNHPLSNDLFFPKPPMLSPNIITVVAIENKFIDISPNAYFNNGELPSVFNITDNKIEKVLYEGYNFRSIKFKQNEYTIQLIANVDSQMQSVDQLNNAIIVSFIALIIIALVLSALLASRVIKPVKEAYNKQVFFVQDSSHEMKTPLAVIKGKLEILANSWGETIDSNFEHISKMMSEVRGLEKLNNDLLLLTKEDIDFSTNITTFELEQLIEDISDFYMDLAEMQNKRFQILKPEEMTVYWDYSKMKRVIIILLENAFKYTNENGSIILSFEEFGKNIKIAVRDTGIGIKQEDQHRIFDRFFRSADVRGKNINGSGIGLSLLKSISKTLGITIKFTSKYGEGTEFKVLVPKIMK